MPIDYRLLTPSDAALLDRVAPDVFDEPIRPAQRDAFLADPRHHLAVAVDDGAVVGFVSAVHYVHPDKPTELWINEAGVAPTHEGLGIGSRLLQLMLAHGRALGCVQAWVLADESNARARAFYAKNGGVAAAERSVMYEWRMG